MRSGKMAGTVRSAGNAGSGAGNVTFVTVHEAGSVKSPSLHLRSFTIHPSRHMVPYDQPEAALVSIMNQVFVSTAYP